jgi:predicted ATPase/DNA-binding SARP family transcriptional activator
MEFRVLGPLEASAGEAVIPLGGARQRALLALLLLDANRVVSGDRLIDALWGSSTPNPGRTALHNVVARLRRLLEPDRVPGAPSSLIVREPSGYVLRIVPEQLDLIRFERLLERGRQALAEQQAAVAAKDLREALSLWRGPPLSDLAQVSFLRDEIARLEERRLAGLELRIEAEILLGQHQELVGELKGLVSEHPLRERFRLQLMRVLYRSGRQAEALEGYREWRRSVMLELGLDPSPELQELERAILRQDPTLTPETSSGRKRTNLPVPANVLIGRRHECAAVEELLRKPDVRLVTLTGAGGSGKSRLALELGWSLLDEFEDGVFLVRLAAISDPKLVGSKIAEALDVSERADERLSVTLAAHLERKRLLLLLDNFEHVLPAAPQVAELLAGGSAARMLVTSRARLRVLGEREVPIPPLPVPSDKVSHHLESISDCSSVVLYVDRARAVRPDFELNGGNAAAVAEICIRLDGLPLAIELAAAKSKLLPPEGLLRRLGRPLALLTDGSRDLPSRQRTLRATIDWSYELLGEDEQRLLTYLAVFSGGWTLEAAEAIASGEVSNLLAGISSLLDNSLITRHAFSEGEPRLTLLETIREYALERLEAHGDAERLRQLHAQYFLGLAEEAEPALRGADQESWLRRLDGEQSNLRAALIWFQYSGKSELLLRLAGAASRFWFTRCHLTEGRQWLEAALLAAPAAPDPLRAKALSGAALLALRQGDYSGARTLLEESLALRRRIGEPDGLALCLTHLGLVTRGEGNFPRAAAVLEESLLLFRKLDSAWGLGACTMNLGMLARLEGDPERARSLSTESVTLFQKCGDRQGIAFALLNAGLAELDQDRPDEAAKTLTESLELFQEVKDAEGIANCLDGFASALSTRDGTVSARLRGAAHALREKVGDVQEPWERDAQQRAHMLLRARLGPDAFANAWTEGQALSSEQACALAQATIQLPSTIG